MTREEALNSIRNIPIGNVVGISDEIAFVKQNIDNYLIERAIKFDEIYESPLDALTDEDFINFLLDSHFNVRVTDGKYYTCGKNVFAKGKLIKMR